MDVRILVVDDNSNVRNSTCRFVRTVGGYKTSMASDAKQALALLNKKRFQIVLTDILMPGMSELELTKVIKKRNYGTDVIVMSSYGEEHFYDDAIESGADDIVLKPAADLLFRIKKILRDRKQKEKYQKEAITDALTGLYNRRHFYRQIKAETTWACRSDSPLSLVMFDIDNFKKYNETYLHTGGDKILVQTSQITGNCLRKTDSVCRYGGDEFVVVLPETAGLEAVRVAQRIRTAVKNHAFSPKSRKKVRVTLSMGVTEYYPDEKIPKFIERAASALKKAKQNGKDRIEWGAK